MNYANIESSDRLQRVAQVLDGLNGVVYKDDSQLVSLHITKVYDHNPGVDIMVREELP